MEYRTIKDLSNLIRTNLWRIPHDIDLVVGIPRSGMIPANLIALYLNIKLSDIDSFIEGRVYNTGARGEFIQHQEYKKVLVVDDSVNSGRALSNAKNKLSVIADKYQLFYLAPIVSTLGSNLVDLYFEIIDDSRVFEWNLFHHAVIETSCLDIDGVLCVDPKVDDDGNIYKNFLLNAEPLFLPTVEIGTLISCRLEKYRNLTELWLTKHNVKYKQLIMLDFPDKKTRVAWGKHGEYKGEYYKNSSDVLFIESSYSQACTIASVSHKPVICIETNELIYIPDTSLCYTIKKKFKQRHPLLFKHIKAIYVKLFKS